MRQTKSLRRGSTRTVEDSRQCRIAEPETALESNERIYMTTATTKLSLEARRAKYGDYDPDRPAPRGGQIWEHRDGGKMYVLGRRTESPRADVWIQRRPFGDSHSDPHFIKHARFCAVTTGRWGCD